MPGPGNWNLGGKRTTARPGLGLDIIHFNLEDFLVDANIITQKEDHFDRRVRENFHKVNENMGYEEFRLISLIFEIGLSSKKYQSISFIDCHFAFLKGFFFGNHLFSDFIIKVWILC
jgi:hypothetical protein